jgi:capsule polysaccharide export protein KpsE/RkpR
LNQYATDENPEVIKTKSELIELHNRLSVLEYKGDNEHFGLGFSIPFKEFPEVTLEFARLKRDVMIQQELFSLLMEQYEKAKIQEVRDTPTVNVLEEPRIPERRSYPIRRVIIISSLVLGFMGSIIMAFFLNWVENLPLNKKEEWKKLLIMLIRREKRV